MFGEGLQARVEHDLAADRVAVQDQGAGVVEQHFARHAPEDPERALQAGKPIFLPLVAKRSHVQAARVAQDGHEQEHAGGLFAGRHPALAEVDLHLFARRRLELHRGPGHRDQVLAQGSHGALDRAQTDVSVARSWLTTSALPSCRRKRAASHSARRLQLVSE